MTGGLNAGIGQRTGYGSAMGARSTVASNRDVSIQLETREAAVAGCRGHTALATTPTDALRQDTHGPVTIRLDRRTGSQIDLHEIGRIAGTALPAHAKV